MIPMLRPLSAGPAYLALLAALALMPAAALAQDEAAADPAAAAQEVPTPYVAATHRDWSIVCTLFAEDQPEACEMYQLITDAQGNPTAEISITPLVERGGVVAGATITTPLETFLPTGMGFRIGEETDQMRLEEFRVCTVIGCTVRMGLSADEITQMQRGSVAFVTIVPFVAIDQQIDLRISLLGFTAALADVRARTPNPLDLALPARVVDPSAVPDTPAAAQD